MLSRQGFGVRNNANGNANIPPVGRFTLATERIGLALLTHFGRTSEEVPWNEDSAIWPDIV